MKLTKVDIYKPEWLNVVFADRNQAYGAYDLRKHNARNTNMALLIAISSFLVVMAVPTIIDKLRGITPAMLVPATTTIVVDNTKLYKVIPEKPVTSAAKQTAKPINDVVKHLPPVVTAEAHNDPPTDAVLAKADPGPVTMTGTHTGEVAPIDAKVGTTNTAGTGNGPVTDAGDGNQVFEVAEVAPEYPGGEAAFSKFLQKNIHYPTIAKENGIQGRAYLQFIVERDGSLTDIKIVRNPGGGTGEEAERVLKMSPHWKPGVQNGNKVRVQFTVPVNFTMPDQN